MQKPYKIKWLYKNNIDIKWLYQFYDKSILLIYGKMYEIVGQIT